MRSRPMSHVRPISTAVLCLLCAANAQAQAVAAATTPPPAPHWTGSAQLSFLRNTGNTETSTFGVGGEANYKASSPWSGRLKGDFTRGEEDGIETLKKLGISIRGGRALATRTDLYVEGTYAEDIYAGIDSRLGGELGVSHKLTVTGKHLVTVEAGMGMVRESR